MGSSEVFSSGRISLLRFLVICNDNCLTTAEIFLCISAILCLLAPGSLRFVTYILLAEFDPQEDGGDITDMAEEGGAGISGINNADFFSSSCVGGSWISQVLWSKDVTDFRFDITSICEYLLKLEQLL